MNERRSSSRRWTQKQRGRPDGSGVGERRKRQRRSDGSRVTLELWLHDTASDELSCKRHTGNISVGGICVDQGVSPPEGTTLTLKFSLPGDPQMVVARARVLKQEEPTSTGGMRLRFLRIEGDGKGRIEDFIQHGIA